MNAALGHEAGGRPGATPPSPPVGPLTNRHAADRDRGTFEVLGRMLDPAIQKSCFIVHHVCMTPDYTMYAAETHNPDRAGYL